MKTLAVLLCFVTAVLAGAILPKHHPATYGFPFHGHFAHKCGNDGFYYKDPFSFIICSNGNAYELPCAPGSVNSHFTHYKLDGRYGYRDFCDINLVDDGYGQPGYQGYFPDYGHQRYYPAHFFFRGHYGNRCAFDGFYYKDAKSFIICSNGNAYELPCAPGTRNSGFDHYKLGHHYGYRSFCDVNLVDEQKVGKH